MKNSYEQTAEILKAENKKSLFDMLYLNQNMTGGLAELIAEFLRDCSTTFVSDIAGKYGKYHLSEKQVWCMTFEAFKIHHMFEAWVEKEMSK